MRGLRNPYLLLGTALLGTGVPFALVAYLLLDSIPLTAMGLSMAILGGVSLALSRALPSVPPAVASLLLEAGRENIAACIIAEGLNQPVRMCSLSSIIGLIPAVNCHGSLKTGADKIVDATWCGDIISPRKDRYSGSRARWLIAGVTGWRMVAHFACRPH